MVNYKAKINSQIKNSFFLIFTIKEVRSTIFQMMIFLSFPFFIGVYEVLSQTGFTADVDGATNLVNVVSGANLQNFNFVAAGDFSCTDYTKSTTSNMISKKPELILALGDLSYQRTPDCWFNTIAPLDKKNSVKIAIGEHDVDIKLTRYNQYIRHFNLTKPYYSFNYQNVHYLAMATGKQQVIPYDNTSEQYRFVKEDLIGAHKNKSISLIIVYSFRPFYSSNTTHPGQAVLRDNYHPLFDKYGVDIVLQAHNHNYQRTYPLNYNQNTPANPIVIDKHLQNYYHPKGPIFVTVGTGGAPLYNFSGQKPYVVAQFARHGFLNVEVAGNGSNLTATFYDNKEMKDIDRFTMSLNHK